MVTLGCPCWEDSGGGTGIRTQGGLLTHAGFQDRCFKPLSHPSEHRGQCTLPVLNVNIDR